MASIMLRACLAALVLYFVISRAGWAQDPVSVGSSSPSSSDPRGSFSPSLHANGSLRMDYFSSSRTLDDKSDLAGATAQVRMLPALSEAIDGKVEARLTNSDLTGKNSAPSAGTLSEGYISMRFKDLELRMGKQIVAWGRADAVNPTDNLTPRDCTVLLPFEEDQRFGTTAIRLDAAVSAEYTIEVFTTPLFEPSKIPLPLPPGAVVRKNHKPAETFANNEVGIKLNKSGGETDWSVSYFHGFSLIPEIRLTGFTPPASLLLELRYPEIDVAGADIARNYGNYGIRAEAAYIAPKNYSSEENTGIQPYFFYVVGTDRTFLESLNINVQFVGRWTPSYRDPGTISDPIRRAVAAENAILFGQSRRATYGFTSRIGERWLNDTLEAELLLARYFAPGNSYLRPRVTYAFTDRIKGSAGGEIYSGAHDSYFGLLKKNQGAFVEIRYNF